MDNMDYMGERAMAKMWERVKNLVNGITSITGNAGSATKLQTARALEGVTFDGSAARHHYGTCSTSGATAAKTCSITGFSLVTGARVIVRFSYANTAANPTLNVSGTGAKYIRYRNAAVPTGYITAGALLGLVYSGTYWYIANDLTQKQVDDLTTKLEGFTGIDAEDVTDSFNWGSCEDYKAYRFGKVVFFRATCTTKSASTMTFATIADAALYPIALTCLECEVVASADATKRPACFAYTDGGIKLTTYSSYSSSTAAATSGNVVISGHWIIA